MFRISTAVSPQLAPEQQNFQLAFGRNQEIGTANQVLSGVHGQVKKNERGDDVNTRHSPPQDKESNEQTTEMP